MNEEKIKAANMAAFKDALAPMQVIERRGRIIVKDETSADGFISQSTINKVAGACCLYGFSGFSIQASMGEGIIFSIY